MTTVANPLVGLRLLVVEDEAMVAMLVEDMLSDLGCIVVEVAANVSKGLELARDASIELDGAILDVNVGSEKVFPVAEVLTARGVPIVFATGYGTCGLDSAYAGCAVLPKPFQSAALRQMLTAALAGSR